MQTASRMDKLIRGKTTKSVTNTHQYDRKIVSTKCSSKSKSKDREKKLSGDIKPSKQPTTQQKLTEVLRKTLALLHRSSENEECDDPLQLAEAIYQHVRQQSVKQRQKTHQTQRSLMQNNSSMALVTRSRQPEPSENINRSNILHYFKQKFGSPINDEKSMERKFRALNILKRSQDLSSRYQSRSIESQQDEKEESLKVRKNNIFLEKLHQKMRV